MIRLSKEQIINLHSQLMKETGGLDGIKDMNLLDSAIQNPFQSFDGLDLYPTIQQKASRLCYSLIMNHPFIDGNKRIGVHVMLVFLALNNIELDYTQKELYTMILKVASNKYSYEQIFKWILNHQI